MDDVISRLANLCVSTVVSVLSKLFADEFKAWSPRLVSALVRSAVSRLPKQEQERYQEEWLSHIEELPGEISRVVSALSLQIASLRIERACLALKGAEIPAEVEVRADVEVPAEVKSAEVPNAPRRKVRQNLTLGLLPEKKLDWRKFAVSYGFVFCVLLILVMKSYF